MYLQHLLRGTPPWIFNSCWTFVYSHQTQVGTSNKWRLRRMSFFKPSSVVYGWRCGVIVCVRMLYYFKMGYNRTHIWHLMGADQPDGRGSPLTKQTIGNYLSQIRSRVALVGLQKMLQVRLSGPCQADESFVRCARKHNVGRINPGRKHTLVILIYFFFTFNGNAGVIVAYPLGIHSVYHPLNLSSHVIMRYSVYGILFKNTWWLLEFLIGRLRLCGLSFITSATWAYK